MPTAVDERTEGSAHRVAPALGRALTLPQVWVVVAVVFPVVILQRQLGSVDLTYHLRAGQLMMRAHSVIRTDTFSFSAHGLPWLDQQWGAQLLLYLAFRLSGWAGLAALHGILLGVTFGFLYLSSRAVGAPARWAAWLSLAAFVVSYEDLSLRPQMFGAALFAIGLWIVWGRRKHPARLWAMPVIVAAWANLHGTFFLGPLLLILAWVQDQGEGDSGRARVLWVSVASLAATLLNPWGPKIWVYAVGIGTNSVITRSISEWAPPSIKHPSGILLFGSLAVVVVVLARRGRKVRWPYLLSLGVFLAMALWASRNTMWWGLALAPTLAAILLDGEPKPSRRYPALGVNTVLAAMFLALVPALFPWWLVGGHLHSRYGNVSYAPTAMTAELRRVLRPGDRIFNAQGLGSWMEFALPSNPVFVDSRIEIYPAQVWRQYDSVSQGEEGWQAILDRWRVRAVVITETQEGSLIPHIERDPGWRLVYHDADGYVFLRSAQSA